MIVRLAGMALLFLGTAACTVPGGGPQPVAQTRSALVAKDLIEKMDATDIAPANRAELEALDGADVDAPQIWRGPSGAYGEVTAGAAYQSGGRPCRDFRHTLYGKLRPESQSGTACKDAGGWRVVSAT